MCARNCGLSCVSVESFIEYWPKQQQDKSNKLIFAGAEILHTCFYERAVLVRSLYFSCFFFVSSLGHPI